MKAVWFAVRRPTLTQRAMLHMAGFDMVGVEPGTVMARLNPTLHGIIALAESYHADAVCGVVPEGVTLYRNGGRLPFHEDHFTAEGVRSWAAVGWVK